MALARRTVPTSLSVYRAPGSLGSHWNLCQRLPQPRLSWSAHSHQPPLVHEDAIPHPAQVSWNQATCYTHRSVTCHLSPSLCGLCPRPLTFFLEEPALVRQDFCRAR